MQLPRASGIVTLLTDFGTADPYVGVMKGMLLTAMPKAVLVDLCHEVPAQDVALGAFFLRSAVGRFPAGTVHVAVVDPGVGTARRILCAYAAGSFWLGPDNGVLGSVLPAPGEGDVRVVDVESLGLQAKSRTFHGRDIFAPVAGWLAGGRFGFEALGGRCGDPVRVADLGGGPRRVIHVDRYGNLITNIRGSELTMASAVLAKGRRIPVAGSYGDVAAHSLLAVVDSYDLVEIAENQGSAAATLGMRRGDQVAIEEPQS
jgi:S-adenosyl-L-methionine hydrolase (adenosine-forming)